MKINVVLDKGAYMPEKAHKEDAGFDIRTPRDVYIPSVASGGNWAVIDSGIHVEIPVGYVGMLKSKSGLNVNDGILGEGVIDSGYTGSIRVKLYNHNGFAKQFAKGDKITQLVIIPIPDVEMQQVNEISGARGDNGFGSTGR